MRITSFPQQVGWLGGKGVDFHLWVTCPQTPQEIQK
jgi:hypothetical protein